MYAGGSSSSGSFNVNSFPAKLWRLVNNPANEAIRWDSLGKGVIVDQQLFERQILSPAASAASDKPDAFKTTNFSSFIRQLNLYGFKKVEPRVERSRHPAENRKRHHFRNPNFRRDHPELVASLRRLTVENKARLQAGLNVSCGPPVGRQRHSGGSDSRGKDVKRVSAGTSWLSPMHQESSCPYHPHKAPAVTSTPIPPQFLIRDYGATRPAVPLPLGYCYTGLASVANAMHMQQGLLVCAQRGGPKFTIFNSPNAHFKPGYVYPGCQFYNPNLVTSHVTGSGIQTGQFSPHRSYQDVQNEEDQEVMKCDINLDTIFQIADEVMQTPPNNCPVKVETPEKPSPVLERPSNTPSTARANSLNNGPIITGVTGSFNVVAYGQQVESVVSVPEGMLEHAKSEVTSDDSEVIDVEVCDSHLDPS